MRKRPGSAFEATVFAIFALALIFFALLLIFPAAAALNSGEGETGVAPAIEISSVQGRLDLQSPSTVAVVLFNNASDQGEVYETDLDPAVARSITAELVSDDGRIQVLSGPQMAGSLGPKENTTVEFMALAEGAEVGIYPARLRLNYSHLERVSSSSQDIAPDIIFVYEERSSELPLPVKVVLGPKIRVLEVRGKARPGEASGLEVVVANEGDETAFDLRLEARAIPPFLRAGDELGGLGELGNESGGGPNQKDLKNLVAGSETSFDLVLLTEANATPGYAPLPCSISYQISPPEQNRDLMSEGGERKEEIALLVMIKEDSYLEDWMLFFAGLLILLILAAAYIYFKHFKRNRPGGRSIFGRKRKPPKSLLG